MSDKEVFVFNIWLAANTSRAFNKGSELSLWKSKILVLLEWAFKCWLLCDSLAFCGVCFHLLLHWGFPRWRKSLLFDLHWCASLVIVIAHVLELMRNDDCWEDRSRKTFYFPLCEGTPMRMWHLHKLQLQLLCNASQSTNVHPKLKLPLHIVSQIMDHQETEQQDNKRKETSPFFTR